MPQKGQVKKQYGFFCFNSEEFAAVPWDEEAAHTYAADVGPYNTFTGAKRALVKALKDHSYDYKQAAKKARTLKLSGL